MGGGERLGGGSVETVGESVSFEVAEGETEGSRLIEKETEKRKEKEEEKGCTSEQAASFCASIKNNDFKQGLAYLLAAELAERDRQYDAIMARVRNDHDLMALVRSSLFGLLLGMGIDCWKELEKRGVWTTVYDPMEL